jgi:hypothetical protein
MATLPYFPIQGLLVKHLLLLLLLIMSVLLSYSGYSQACAYNQSAQAINKGYWKLRTDHLTRQTIVWFYNGSHELIYKEALTHKYVKANKKNKRRLDEILANLVESKFVASQVKATELQAATNQLPFPTSTAGLAPLVPVLPKDSKVLRTIALASSASKGVSIWIENPKKEKVFLSLREDKVTPAYRQAIHLYRRVTYLPTYNLFLDVSTLPGGQYKLEVIAKNKQYSYTLKV